VFYAHALAGEGMKVNALARGVRRGGGVSLVCGSCTEREKASV
jgi:hypothetical protein